MMKNLVVVQGPTAVGKTAVAVELAKYFKTSIINADSRQFYREMTIGTAVPSQEELNSVRHYFVHDRSIAQPLNAGSYAEEALNSINRLFEDNDIVIMAGGSGLYVNAVIYGMDDLPSDKNVRNDLNNCSLDELLVELKQLDPAYYDIVDRDNRQRVVRALEVCRISGQTYTSLRKGNKRNNSMNVIQIALTGPREKLYEKINSRVDLMMSRGLLDEVKSLYKYREYPALNTVGYKELFLYLDGKCSLDDAVSMIKQNTRHYAKRQLTWLRPNHDINWFDSSNYLEILDFIKKRITK